MALAAPFIILGGVVGIWALFFIVGLFCNMQPPQKRSKLPTKKEDEE